MPRNARYVLPGVALHVVQRGIDRHPCFFSAADYESYLHFLAEAAARFACTVHAYCLMTNHVHLLMTPHEDDSCGAFMKFVGQCYVQSTNRRLSRTGTLWEGRFRSCLVQSERYVLACYRYIELNPVRAGIVALPSDYPWSSYLCNTGSRAKNLVRDHPAYEALAIDPVSRSEAYATLCAEGLPEAQLEEIRKATKVGCVIGTLRRGRGRPVAAR